MSATLTRSRRPKLQFRGLFPDWQGGRPLSFYFMEQLLEARAESRFPTNAAGPDEDVNVYLADLLTRLAVDHDPRAGLFGCQPQLLPPQITTGRRQQSHWYRRQADQRLLYLGLFERGEGRRRRAVLYGFDRAQTRQRDLICGQVCYETAATLLRPRPGQADGLAPVLAKLGRHFPDYVHVLGVLATRRFGLGAKLSDRETAALLADPHPCDPIRDPAAGSPAVAPQRSDLYDQLLDQWLEFRRTADPAARTELLAKAAALGVSPAQLGESACGEAAC